MKKVKVSVFLCPEIAKELRHRVADGSWRGRMGRISTSAYIEWLLKRTRNLKGPGGQPGPTSKEDL